METLKDKMSNLSGLSTSPASIVNFNQAVMLSRLGFDDFKKCHFFYNIGDGESLELFTMSDYNDCPPEFLYLAPHTITALNWCKEVKGYGAYVDWEDSICQYRIDVGVNGKARYFQYFYNYEKALQTILDIILFSIETDKVNQNE